MTDIHPMSEELIDQLVACDRLVREVDAIVREGDAVRPGPGTTAEEATRTLRPVLEAAIAVVRAHRRLRSLAEATLQ